MSVYPIGNRIVARRILAENKVGGIFLPDSSKKRTDRAIVLERGYGKGEGSWVPSVEEGDEIIVQAYTGNDVSIDGEDVTLFDFDDILGVIEKVQIS